MPEQTRILIVEDDALAAVELEQKLRLAGFEVISTSTSGDLALQQVATARPDVVLMDIRLPGTMDGIETAEQMRVRYDIPIIYLTAFGDAGSIERAKATAPFGYLLKPVSAKELQIAIEMALYKHTLDTELREANQRLEQEIEERKQREAQIAHLNMILRSIRNINQLITKEKDRARLLQGACNHLIETRGFSYAKLLLLDESGKLLRAYEAEIGEQFQAFVKLLESGYTPYCVRHGLATREILVIEDVPAVCGNCPLAPAFANDRKMTIRLEYGETCYGLLTVSLPRRVAVDEEEQSLLQEVAGDIAFALHDIELEEQRKRAEEALRENEAKMRSIFRAAPIGIGVVSNRVFLDVNDRLCEITGYSKDELIGKNARVVYSSDEEYEYVGREKYRQIQEQGTGTVETHFKRKDGKIIDVLLSSTPLDPADLSTGVTFTALDITKRKRAEEALRESEQRFRSIVENTDAGYFFIDKEGFIRDVNKAWINMYKYAFADEILGNHFTVIQKVEDVEEAKEFVDGIMRGDERYLTGEFSRKNKDGSIGYHTFSARPVMHSGEVIGIEGFIIDTTQHKRVEEALRESEQRFRSLFEAMIEGVALHEVIYDETQTPVDYVIVDVNPAYESHTNISRQTAIGKTASQLYGSNTPPYLDIYSQVVLSGQPTRFETYFLPMQKHFRISIFRPGEGQFATIFEDITERKQAEKELQKYREHLEDLVEERTVELHHEIKEHQKTEAALRLSESRFRTISELVSDYAYMLGVEPEGYLVREWVTDACTRITGYTPEEIDARGGWLTIVHPDFKAIFQQHRQLYLAGEESVCEYCICSKGGDVFWLRDYSRPIWDETHSRIVQVFGAAQDITRRKQAEETILLLKNAIETTKVGVTITDQERNILYVNPAEATMHGYTVEELLGQDSRLFSPKEYWQDITFDQLEHHWERESVNIRQDGTTFPVHSVSTPVRNSAGAPIGIITVSEDITARKQTEEELQKAKDEAEAANFAKSTFLANMSHEIRTPMNAILGFSQILEEQLQGHPQYQEYLAKIISSGNSLLCLINDILDLSKIEAGRLEIQPEPFNLRTMLVEVQHIFSLQVKQKGLRLVMQVNPDVPAQVVLDEARIRQILINLIGNAVKFTQTGNITVSVTMAPPKIPVSNKIDLSFEVKDTGIGIAPEDLQRMFDSFQQVGETRGKFGGTGLGLTITRRLVEIMRGTITVESELKRGTTFTIMLPNITVVPSEKIVPPMEVSRVTIQFQGATVLLVEDNESNRAVVRGYLGAAHLNLIEAENGQAALATLTHTRPDLILMDIHMPVMGGNETTKQIRNSSTDLCNIPVVALTAYAMTDQRAQFEGLYDDYLTKPLAKDDLIAMLTKFLPHTKQAPLEELVSSEPEQPEFFVELKRYAEEIRAFPEDFLETLHDELFPQYRRLKDVMSVDDLMSFSETLAGAGQHFQIAPLQHYGEELLRYTKVFDITNMKRLLAFFPGIVEIIDHPEVTKRRTR